MDVMQYAELFQAEAGEYMQQLNQCLLNLEKDPKDREELLEIFRIVHSLKGMAGTMGYQHVTNIAHGLETFMEDYKSSGSEPSPEVLDLLFEAIDLLNLSLNNPEESTNEELTKWKTLQKQMSRTKEEGVVTEEVFPNGKGENVDAVFELGAMDQEILRQSADKGSFPYQILITLKEDTLMKAVRVYMILKVIEDSGEIIVTSPLQQELEDEKFAYQFHILAMVKPKLIENIKEKILSISDVEHVSAEKWEDEEIEFTMPFSAEDKQIVAGEQVETKEIEGEKEQVAATQKNDANAASGAADKMVRVETKKLDDLVNLVGEMVVARTRIMEIGKGFSDELDSTIDQLKGSITNLQDTAMGLRMVPIKQVFDRFPRMVRDLCRDKGKEVELHISGEETELDRSIINKLSDPLVHLIRNAFDHGIESPEERGKKNKNVRGAIHLTARHEGNQVVITVEDDGAGIDPQKIGEIAIKKGIISRDELYQLSKEDMISLIFFNGFSTSEKITDVSGRGVGMDAVRNSIEALHGSVEVHSEINVRTRFMLRMPLTLAIIKTLLVKSADQLYAIPVEIIRQNVYLDKSQVKSIRGKPVVNLRGEVIALYYLSSMLGFTTTSKNERDYSVVIVEVGSRKAGIIVDELVGQQEIMIKSLGSYLKGLKGIAGATVLGDGTVTLIIDVAGLLSEGRDFVGQNSIGS